MLEVPRGCVVDIPSVRFSLSLLHQDPSASLIPAPEHQNGEMPLSSGQLEAAFFNSIAVHASATSPRNFQNGDVI